MRKEVLPYFIETTNKRFDTIDAKLDDLFEKLADIHRFKVEMIVSTRWISLIVSAACGLATMLVTAYISRK